MKGTKYKISITLAPDLLRAADRAAKRHSPASRSAVIESWLRRGAQRELEDELRAETIAYYESLSGSERKENVAISRAAARASRRLRLDDA
jgi:metal-responsive CopG/Arc/MetJ family transcriptional regulator